MRSDTKPVISIYCDGSCINNPGPGGWCAILTQTLSDGVTRRRIIDGSTRRSTNNKMELTAAIKGLEALRRPCKVTIYSDSKYLVDTVNFGYNKGANIQLWNKLDKAMASHIVTLIWVKGHNGNELNEIANKRALAQARSIQ